MINEYEKHRYDDIINLPHHQSEVHPHMSMYDRAAQFSPFAALTGHEEAISETSRLTDARVEISEDVKQKLNERLSIAAETIGSGTVFEFTYFVPDDRKSGGAYITKSGCIKKVDPVAGLVLLEDHTTIDIKEIISIESDLFKNEV